MSERTAIYEAEAALNEVIGVFPSNYRERVDQFGVLRVAFHVETIDRLVDSLLKIQAVMPSKAEVDHG
jgi:hypothetical protein